MKEILENNLRQFFSSLSTSNAVIGVSGGVDSAVTLAIAVNALGKENVIALLMPYQLGETSSYENFEDAKKLCESFGVEYQICELDDFIDPFIKKFTQENIKNPLVLGNTLARIRMTLLFAEANNRNALVLGTCNKTEVMLGYETKFGDGACDISVIGDLWKNEVYAVAKEYNLPDSFTEKSPSAELYAGQSDEEEMGFSYEIADRVCQEITEGKKTFDMTNEGNSNNTEQKIYSLFTNSHHKRVMPQTLSKFKIGS